MPFGTDHNPRTSPAGSLIRRLYYRLTSPEHRSANRAFDGWTALLSEAFHLEAVEKDAPGRSLAAQYDLENPAPKKLLFAVHTYFSLVAKSFVWSSLNGRRPEKSTQELFTDLESPAFWRSVGIDNFVVDDVFAWYLDAFDDDLEEDLSSLLEYVAEFAVSVPDRPGVDVFKDLYQTLVPPAVRHSLGEYYTPRWLVEMTLQEVGFDGDEDRRVLDPACGSGAYLIAAIEAVRRSTQKPSDADLVQTITDNIIGFDLNPLAVLAARANYALAIGDLIDSNRCVELPVYHCDTLPPCGTVDLFSDHRRAPQIEPVDFVVGNPPWINWQTLDERRRDELKPLWESYGLFSLSGTRGRLGGGKKDLSMLFTYVCCDHYLRDGGRLGFLITRSVFKSKGAGDGFRRFRFDDGEPVVLEPVTVDDFSDFQPFEGATTETALLCLRKGREPFDYPVTYHRWTKTCPGRIDADSSLADARADIESRRLAARPIDPNHDTAPWLTAAPEVVDALTRVYGDSHYTAREGVNSGGLNGCYWVREIERGDDGLVTIENLHDVGKIKVEPVETTLESERVFPLLRSGDVSRWHAAPSTSIILAQDPQTRSGIPESKMKRDSPRTYEYLRRFEGDAEAPKRGTLRGRSLFRRYYKPSDPFYSMYGVGPYTMATWKVCWTRIDTRLRAAVVGPDDQQRPVLPQETITFVPFDDPAAAHYFCALFNSSPADRLVRSYSTGKGFASAHVLESVAIPEFDDGDSLHGELSEHSRKCHQEAVDGDDDGIAALEEAIDELAATLWGLGLRQLESLQGSSSQEKPPSNRF